MATTIGIGRKAAALLTTDGYPDHLVAGESSADLVDRVFLDGVDITLECFEVHRSQGWARCCVRGADGHFIIDGDEWSKYEYRNGELVDVSIQRTVRKKFIRGKVVVQWKTPDNFTVRKYICKTDG